MPTPATAFKVFLLVAGSVAYLVNSFRIGFWLSGNMHNGGPLVGPLLFPPLLAAATFLLFINRPRVRMAVAFGLLAYLTGVAVLLHV